LPLSVSEITEMLMGITFKGKPLTKVIHKHTEIKHERKPVGKPISATLISNQKTSTIIYGL